MDFLKQIFHTSPNLIKIGFEDIKIAINVLRTNPNEYIIINTMPDHFQNNLIMGTLNSISEESVMNRVLDNYEMKRTKVILYGLNATDESVEKKAQQLQGLGFSEIYIYSGGMFEWLLLQELYGSSEFPTTSTIKPADIIKYRPLKKLGTLLIEN
jgi:hypothetical protein